MKITLKTVQPERKIVAVIGKRDGDGPEGLFLRSPITAKSVYHLSSDGLVVCSGARFDMVASFSDRLPVYEGDTIEVTF